MGKVKYLLTQFLFFFSVSSSCQLMDDSAFLDFLNHLKALEYEDARLDLSNLGTIKPKVQLELLLNILSEGSTGDPSKLNPKGIKVNNDDISLEIIIMLCNGYYELYFNPNKSMAFKFFYEAFSKSSQFNIQPLEKFILISLLEYFKSEIARNNKDYIEYLEKYEKLKEDFYDDVRIGLYKVFFLSADVRGYDSSYFKAAKKLDSFEEGLMENHPLMSEVKFEKGLFNEFIKKFELSQKYYEETLKISKLYPFQNQLSFSTILKLAKIKHESGDNIGALKKLDEINCCLNPNDSLKDQFYIDYYRAKFHYGLNNYKKAFEALENRMEAGYQLDYRENSLEISKLNAKYQTAEKEKQILEEQQKVRTNRNWLIAASAVLFFSLGFGVLIYKNTTKKRQLAEQEALLKQQRVENLLKEQELLSIDAMIAGQEKERQKVAGELHDDLGSLMATIKLHFDNAKVSKEDPALQNAQKLLEEAYQKIRGMAHNKNSGVMSNQGLLPAIKKMANTITKTNALKVSVEDFGMGERMENSLELSIFRMVQELVTNAIKHADATKVNIQLTQHEDNLNIIVEDNGTGFDRSQLDKNKSGMGLTNIEKRVEHLEGNFTVDSVVGKGTSILIDIPV